MAGKVFFSVTMSLDGFMAPEAVPLEDVFSPEGQNDPRVQRWMAQWMELQQWIFPQRFFRENLKDRKSTRLNSSHIQKSRMPSSA